jgi:hypothetical protein
VLPVEGTDRRVPRFRAGRDDVGDRRQVEGHAGALQRGAHAVGQPGQLIGGQAALHQRGGQPGEARPLQGLDLAALLVGGDPWPGSRGLRRPAARRRREGGGRGGGPAVQEDPADPLPHQRVSGPEPGQRNADHHQLGDPPALVQPVEGGVDGRCRR